MTDQVDQTTLARLVESDQLFRQVIDTLPGYVMVKSWDGVFELVNRSYAAHYGTSVEAMVGSTLHDFNPDPEQVAEFVLRDQETIRAGQPVYLPEQRVPGSKGQTFYYEITKIPMAGDRLLVMVNDITERKQAEIERERLQQEIIAAQRQALKELSTPIIPVLDGVIILPLIGAIDSYRARDITRSLLAGISEHRAHVVILDLTGVPVVDSGVADNLNKTIQAARLKGARTIVSGISDAVAETIVDLGIDWSQIETVGDLQTGLRMGTALKPKNV